MQSSGSPTGSTAPRWSSPTVAPERETADARVRELVEEAVRLVLEGSPTRLGVRALMRLADHDPGLLDAAGHHCAEIRPPDGAAHQGAAQLLRRAASQLRIEERAAGIIRTRAELR